MLSAGRPKLSENPCRCWGGFKDKHGFDSACLVLDEALEMCVKRAIFAQQVVEVEVQKPVFPNALWVQHLTLVKLVQATL